MTRYIAPLTETPDATLKRIEQRVAGRNMARELFTLIEGDAADRNYMESLIEELRRLSGLVDAEIADEEEPEKVPIARLGARIMEYGEFNGRCADDIPPARLDWYLRKAEETVTWLSAYLNHPDFESRRSGET
jgi:hypothetical protein